MTYFRGLIPDPWNPGRKEEVVRKRTLGQDLVDGFWGKMAWGHWMWGKRGKEVLCLPMVPSLSLHYPKPRPCSKAASDTQVNALLWEAELSNGYGNSEIETGKWGRRRQRGRVGEREKEKREEKGKGQREEGGRKGQRHRDRCFSPN